MYLMLYLLIQYPGTAISLYYKQLVVSMNDHPSAEQIAGGKHLPVQIKGTVLRENEYSQLHDNKFIMNELPYAPKQLICDSIGSFYRPLI